MFNPYLDTAPVTDAERLFGRQKLLRRILVGVLGPRPVCQQIIGLSESGKTSLLKSLLGLARPENQGLVEQLGFQFRQLGRTLFVYLDCSGLENAPQFWYMLGRELEREIKKTLNPMYELIPCRSFFDFRLNLSSVMDSEVNHFDRAVILFDEFEYVAQQPGMDIEVSRNLRALFDNFERLAYLTATTEPLLTLYERRSHSEQPQKGAGFVRSRSSSLHNIFDKTEYTGLLEDGNQSAGVMDFIRGPARDHGVAFSEQDVDFALALGGRHPDLTRMICGRLFDERILQPKGVLDYKTLEERVRTDFASFALILEAELSEKQKQIIYETVSAPPPRKISREAEPQIEILLDLGLLVRSDGKIKPFSPLLEEFRPDDTLSMAEEIGEDSDDIALHPAETTVIVRGKPKKLSPKEWQLLTYLYERSGEVCTREKLQLALANGNEGTSRTNLSVIVRRLRDKIEKDPKSPRLIVTVRGEGYKLGQASR